MTPKQIKALLFETCQKAVADRRVTVEKSIASIEQALHEESKGTSGDKHHTARAMLQIDREQAGRQLHEVESLEISLRRFQHTDDPTHVRLGSLVHTNHGSYFLCISLGQVVIEQTNYGVLGPKAPLGQLLMGKSPGDQVAFRDRIIQVIALF